MRFLRLRYRLLLRFLIVLKVIINSVSFELSKPVNLPFK